MSDSAKTTDREVAAILAPQATAHININGYTDNTPIGPVLARSGGPTNQILSEKRAQNVMQYMVSQGVNPAVSSGRRASVRPIRSPRTIRRKARRRIAASS